MTELLLEYRIAHGALHGCMPNQRVDKIANLFLLRIKIIKMDFSREKKKIIIVKNEKEDGKIIEVCGGN